MNMSIKEISAGDTDKDAQLEYLMRRFGKQVHKLAYYYLRDKHIAEDICQEVFIKVYRNLEKFRIESSYYTWIYRITVNLCKDYLKSAAFRRFVTAGLGDDWYRSAMRTNKLFVEADGGEIFSLVMNLPEKYRVPISLHYFDGFSVSEIANVMKISESNVKVRLHRGRKMLKDLLPLEVVK
ncbi:MAG TPA: sigma-70 family RNA polymerase sigma factor [Clostridiales bacterium]|nr:sigma-70 family RNA polymerase sigma factor [Clostridiales bacterium]